MEGLRKVNEYTQFEDGRMIEKIKFKPLGLPMKNRVTVMLFDAITKKLKQKTVTENILNNSLDRMAYMDYFYQRVKANPTAFAYASPFQYLVLTDSAEAESASQQYMKGNIIGYAEKLSAYSGSDLFRGTINTNESSIADSGNTGYLKFVYDFGATIANGTFRSVWWHPTIGLKFSKLMTGPSTSGGSNQPTMDADLNGNILYVSGGGNFGYFYVDRYNLDTLAYIDTTNLQTKNPSLTGFNRVLWGISVYNNQIYVNNGDTTHTIFVFDLNFNYVKTITLNFSGDTSGTFSTIELRSMKIINGYIYITATNGYMLQFDINGNFLSSCKLADTSYLPLLKIDNNLLIANDCYLEIKDDKMIAGPAITNSISHAGVMYNGKYISVDGNIATMVLDSYIPIPPATQCLLPTTVTKDASQTMKIVYEFNIDQVNPYDAS